MSRLQCVTPAERSSKAIHRLIGPAARQATCYCILLFSFIILFRYACTMRIAARLFKCCAVAAVQRPPSNFGGITFSLASRLKASARRLRPAPETSHSIRSKVRYRIFRQRSFVAANLRRRRRLFAYLWIPVSSNSTAASSRPLTKQDFSARSVADCRIRVVSLRALDQDGLDLAVGIIGIAPAISSVERWPDPGDLVDAAGDLRRARSAVSRSRSASISGPM